MRKCKLIILLFTWRARNASATKVHKQSLMIAAHFWSWLSVVLSLFSLPLRPSLSSASCHKGVLTAAHGKPRSGGANMHVWKLPLEKWIVVDRTRAPDGDHVVSAHATQDEAEGERDKRNRASSHVQYYACIAFEPVAQGMSRPCR
jgi:hypothetical protein